MVFHLWDLNDRDLPENRLQDQYYVLFSLESPLMVPNKNLTAFDRFFNLTITYRYYFKTVNIKLKLLQLESYFCTKFK